LIHDICRIPSDEDHNAGLTVWGAPFIPTTRPQHPFDWPLPIVDPPYPSMSTAGVTTFLPHQVDEATVIQFVALVQDDDLETMIRAAREKHTAAIEWNSLVCQLQALGAFNNWLAGLSITAVTIRSRMLALHQIVSAADAEVTAAEWRVFNRYCTGK
jgi:hypothetical protein